ncbi:DUF3037 domain-containing protein [Pedobacter immunditicola]|uniref:DUF3037 domain-containing protein n=1 Tax=Pedobacter immunditicola TaxID=3133440 RepID=UPI0030AFDBD7
MKHKMQEQFLYEYALVRVVPRVEREEFLNVGVILYCAKQKFLKLIYIIEPSRLHALCPKLDLNELESHLQALDKICAGGKDSGPIGSLDLPSRFRWLTATRSTIVQTSKVHPGFCTDATATLEKLYQTMVL